MIRRYYYGHKYELKKVFLDIFKDIGVIAPACRQAGISRTTFYRWLEWDEEFNAQFIEATEECIERHRELLEQIPPHKMHSMLSTLLSDF